MALDKRQLLIDCVGQRMLVVVDTAPPFVGHQVPVRVGLRAFDCSERWFEDAQSLGAALADDAGFQALELGTWRNSPDGALIADAVGQVLSPGFGPEYQLVVDGLRCAANHQSVAGWQRAVGAVVLTALLGCGLWFSGRD